MQSTVHEIRNQLAVAVANIEAFIDRKIKPTPDRLNSVLAALLEVDVLIDELKPGASRAAVTKLENSDICELLLSEAIGIEAAAAAAGIELRVDRCATKHPDCAAFPCDPGQIMQLIKKLAAQCNPVYAARRIRRRRLSSRTRHLGHFGERRRSRRAARRTRCDLHAGRARVRRRRSRGQRDGAGRRHVSSTRKAAR